MAEHDADAATQLSDRLHEPGLRIGIALLLGNIGDHRCAACAETERHYNEALLLAQQFEMREGEAAAHAGLARVFRARGANQAALAEIDQTLSLTEHSRSSLTSRELAASYFSGRRDWYRFAIDTAMETSRDTNDMGEAAFRYGERARARTMLDIVGEHKIGANIPDAALERRIAANGASVATSAGSAAHELRSTNCRAKRARPPIASRTPWEPKEPGRIALRMWRTDISPP